MSYDPPTFEVLLQDALTAYRNQVAGADTSPGSEIYARCAAVAGAVAQLGYGVVYVEDQIFPDTCDEASLLRHAAMYELTRKDPTAAGGLKVTLEGVNGTVVASGLTATHEDGTQFLTTSGGTIAGGVLEVDADAVTTGTVGNKSLTTELTVTSPPPGVQSICTVTQEAEDPGTDQETIPELRDRVLLRMRAGNAGGTHTDYEQWALEVDGTFWADTLESRAGPGTVSVAVYSKSGSGTRTPAGSSLRADVLAKLETLRPVCAEVDVPVVSEVTVSLQVDNLEVEPGFDPTDVQTAVSGAMEAHIWALRTGATGYRHAIGRAISAVDGVKDYSLVLPAANVTATVDSSVVQVLIPATPVVNLL